MSRFGIVMGLLLCGLSLVAMVFAPAKGPTQFIPLISGIPLLFFGVTGLNPHRRRNSVWASLVAALLAAMYGIGRFFQLLGHDEPLAVVDERVVVTMTLITIGYLIVGAISLRTPRTPLMIAKPNESDRRAGPPRTSAA